jgi:5-methylcytosine-specific restriction endonuclease McrA
MKPPTASEKRHMARVAAMGCLVCGAPAQLHHVTARIEGGRIERRHDRVTPLCPKHHQIQHGPKESVEALSHRGFWLEYGIDLLAESERLADG